MAQESNGWLDLEDGLPSPPEPRSTKFPDLLKPQADAKKQHLADIFNNRQIQEFIESITPAPKSPGLKRPYGCSCSELLGLYVPPGETVELPECPVHKNGKRVISGGPKTWCLTAEKAEPEPVRGAPQIGRWYKETPEGHVYLTPEEVKKLDEEWDSAHPRYTTETAPKMRS